MGAKHAAKLKFHLQAAIEVGKIMEIGCHNLVFIHALKFYPHRNFGYEAILLVLQCRNVVINWNRTEWTGPCAVNKAKVEQIVVKSLEFHSEKGRGIHILEDRRVPLKNHNPNHEILHVLKLISS